MSPRPVGGLRRVAGLEHLVGGGLVDRLLVQAAQLDDPLAQLGAGRERRDGLVEERLGRRRRCRRRRLVAAGRLAGGGELAVGVEGVDEVARDLLEARCRRRAASSSLALVRAEPAVEPGEAGGDRGDRRRGRGLPKATCLRSFSSGTVGLRSSGGVDEVVLGDADGVDDHEARPSPAASGVTAWKSASVDDADAAALHLLEVGAARDRRA